MKLLFTIPAIASLLMGSVTMAEETKAVETKEEFVPGILRPLKAEKVNGVVVKETATLWLYHRKSAGMYPPITAATSIMETYEACLIALNNLQQQYKRVPVTHAACIGNKTGRVDSIHFGNKVKRGSSDLGVPMEPIKGKD